ncbi:hypothetical protein SM124_07620 [Bacillus sp. 31A1R]|uniref:Uncharacterized protein n=1 Tax=Robertmurraya mangrovi TaxID=3098077 RepID=A0ABU5IWV7_9BACI|nr:hypothetical protein [Bacillus sp. 31A1R]MDZ5471615.1 hypothetical protein [Bacillus sp. 31A1R]
MNNTHNVINECRQLAQQLINQTEQGNQQYRQMLQQEQQNAQMLEQLVQRERQAAQYLQQSLQNHHIAIQRCQEVINLCNQMEQQMSTQMGISSYQPVSGQHIPSYNTQQHMTFRQQGH